MLPYLPLLRDAGHQCDVAYSFPEKYEYFPRIGWRASQWVKRSTRRFHALLAKWRTYDTIIIEREVFDDETVDLERRFRNSTRRLVLDVDDGVHLRHPQKIETIAAMCDAVIVGNRFLDQVLGAYCDRTVVIPTCVRMRDYRQRTGATSDPPTVGWVGTTDNVAFLQVCAAALRQAARQTPFRLLVVSASDKHLRQMDLEGVSTEFRRWSAEAEIENLHAMDIGLMPLPSDQPWMKYKCGLKLIQYLAIGIPGIASPIGVNAEILLRDQETPYAGFCATDTQQWTDALVRLLVDPELRQSMGRAGRQRVIDDYSIEGHSSAFEAVLTG
jgi:glycosyltransferase involved in cell wall biosynthesis